ncbi:MAG: hypothetical protein KF764_34375 [Labilithrix sp.]|nr:hypothetical protein [Labilithrix sp.]
MSIGLFTRALTAEEVLEAFPKVAVAFGDERTTLSITTNAGHRFSTKQGVANALPANEALPDWLKAVKDRPHLLAVTASLTFPVHPTTNHAETIVYRTDDGAIGRFELTLASEPERYQLALEALEGQFELTSYVDLVANAGRLEGAALQFRERGVAAVDAATQKLAGKLAEIGARDAESRREALQAQEAEYRRRLTELEESFAERKRLADEEHKTEMILLAEDRRKHEVEVNKFVTIESKRMRRDLLKMIQGTLDKAKDFSLSTSTVEKRLMVHIVTGLLLTVVGCVAGIYVYRLAFALKPTEALWHDYALVAAPFATLVTTFVYYLKWNDRWFREHADNEFAASRYRADILRASWVAELVSEWQAESEEELPPELLSAFTRNLFRDGPGSKESEHPLDAITGMMKRVTSVSVGKNSFTVEGLGERTRRKKQKQTPKTSDGDVVTEADDG